MIYILRHGVDILRLRKCIRVVFHNPQTSRWEEGYEMNMPELCVFTASSLR